MDGLADALSEGGVVAAVLGHPTCFDVLFGVHPKQGVRALHHRYLSSFLPGFVCLLYQCQHIAVPSGTYRFVDLTGSEHRT